MSKFKVGDKVRIRKDLNASYTYGGVGFVSSMAKYRGKAATITDVYDDVIALDIDNGFWGWSEEMFESASQTLKIEYDETLKCYFINDGQDTICFKEFGMSRTSPEDIFDEKMGKAIAYYRLIKGELNE